MTRFPVQTLASDPPVVRHVVGGSAFCCESQISGLDFALPARLIMSHSESHRKQTSMRATKHWLIHRLVIVGHCIAQIHIQTASTTFKGMHSIVLRLGIKKISPFLNVQIFRNIGCRKYIFFFVWRWKPKCCSIRIRKNRKMKILNIQVQMRSIRMSTYSDRSIGHSYYILNSFSELVATCCSGLHFTSTTEVWRSKLV